MTRVELEEATGSLSEYTRKARKGPVVVTRQGKPVALLRLLDKDEWEDYVVTTSSAFRRILKRSEAGYKAAGGVSLEQVEREFKLPPRRNKRGPSRRRSK